MLVSNDEDSSDFAKLEKMNLFNKCLYENNNRRLDNLKSYI